MKTDTNKDQANTVVTFERTNSSSLAVHPENNSTNFEKRLTTIEIANKLNMRHMAVVMDSKDPLAARHPAKKTSYCLSKK